MSHEQLIFLAEFSHDGTVSFGNILKYINKLEQENNDLRKIYMESEREEEND